MYSEKYSLYLNALIKGDRDSCLEIIKDAMEKGEELLNIYLDFIQRSLYDIGDMWQANKISVAVEHLATSTTEGLLGYLFPIAAKVEKNGLKVVITSCANELHQIGGRIVADYMEIKGWDSHYLGADTPVMDFINFVLKIKPDVIGLSISLYSNIKYFNSYLLQIDTFCPDIPVMWTKSDLLEKYDNATMVRSLNELDSYLEVYSNGS